MVSVLPTHHLEHCIANTLLADVIENESTATAGTSGTCGFSSGAWHWALRRTTLRAAEYIDRHYPKQRCRGRWRKSRMKAFEPRKCFMFFIRCGDGGSSCGWLRNRARTICSHKYSGDFTGGRRYSLLLFLPAGVLYDSFAGL